MEQRPQSFLRYRVIDRCLQQRNKIWNHETLAEACTEAVYELSGDRDLFSRATIMRDIRIMRAEPPQGYGAPIHWDRQRKSYYYADPHFSINNSPLAEQDLHFLQQAVQILQQIPHLAEAAPWQQVSTQLQHSLRMQDQQQSIIVQFDTAPPTRALRWLRPLYRAIDEKTALRIRYQPFTEDAQFFTISPWLLKQYNRRWFLLAWCRELERVRTYALDRILQLEPNTDAPWFIRHDFDPQQHYNQVIGMSIPEEGKVVRVQFRAQPLRAKYIASKPLHHSQRILEQNEQHTVFELRLIPNIELQQILLSFGPEIEVLGPAFLRQEIARLHQAAAAAYR
jgi:predicted DNA-binding transcriptional regulator YafY